MLDQMLQRTTLIVLLPAYAMKETVPVVLTHLEVSR